MTDNIMKYKEYRAKIHYDGEENIFWGEVLGINDVLAFHADNTKDLVQHFHDCIDDYIDFCKEMGKEPEKEYSGTFSVRVAPKEQRTAALCASAMNISLNQYYGNALVEYNKLNIGLINA